MEIVLLIVVLIFSVIIHEISHGYVALWLGDTTAKDAGRLTLNPIKHIDPIGSIFLPLILALVGGPVFGWAKPVPYNPYNLRDPQRGAGLIGAAGPISNLLLATIFGLLARIVAGVASFEAQPALIFVFGMIAYINILLAIFNLLPVPPLDGSKVLFAVLPRGSERWLRLLEQYGFLLLLLIIFTGVLSFLIPFVLSVLQLLMGKVAFGVFLTGFLGF